MQQAPNKNNTTVQDGLVISYFGNSVAVETADGQVFQCHLRRNQALPVVGDRVRWQMEDAETGRVLEIEPRHSLLSRGEAHGKQKPLAANVDVIAIVMAPPPIFSEHMVDCYLVAAELLNIAPVIVLNKVDLLNEQTLDEASAHLAPYQAMGYPVVLSSAIANDGLEGLFLEFTKKTAVLVGPSGVGKSSIIAAMAKMAGIQIGDVTAKGVGRHTTTATRLYHLPNGGNLIDSPGVREFNLWAIQPGDVLKGFRDIKAHLTGCKFRNCSHLVEPECAVQAAVMRGDIYPSRFASFQALMKAHK